MITKTTLTSSDQNLLNSKSALDHFLEALRMYSFVEMRKELARHSKIGNK